MTDHADHAVLIAGSGPTGMALAAELAIAGTDVAIVERRATQELESSRAGGLHARTLEVLDQRGALDRFLAEGEVMQVQGFAMIPLDISDLPTRHPHGLALWQRHIERILAGWVEELGVPTLRSTEVVGVDQDPGGVDVALSDGTTRLAGHLVGCDGGRSAVRRAVGIEAVGLEPSTSWLIAEADLDGDPPFGIHHDADGMHGLSPLPDEGTVRVLVTDPQVVRDDEPSLDDLRAALRRVWGSELGLRGAAWVSRFTDATRQAVTYRRGRVLLAGDAAHTHPPQGGQGLNTGVQDAVNLGWKLALVAAGAAPDALLDTYEAERHPVAARVLHNTMAQVALGIPDDRHRALRDITAGLLALDEPRRQVAGMMSGLDIAYDLGGRHPLVGRRMPDLDLTDVRQVELAGAAEAGRVDGVARVAELLHAARPVLLVLGAPTPSRAGGASAADVVARSAPAAGATGAAPSPSALAAVASSVGPWLDRVDVVVAEAGDPWASEPGTWALPVVGDVPAVPAVLVRPDGHVAWVGDVDDADDTGLTDLPRALTRWFGPPRR